MTEAKCDAVAPTHRFAKSSLAESTVGNVRRRAMLSASGFIMLPFVAAATAPLQSYDTYRSWLVACDNTLRCEAKGLEDGTGLADARIVRDAGPAGEVEMVIAAQQRFTMRDLRVDGRPVPLLGADWKITNEEGGTSISTTRLAVVRSMLARLRSGTRLTFGGGDAAVPLDGLVAALIRIDERQGRAGGTTALARLGPALAARVPEAPAVPRLQNRRIKEHLAPGEGARLIARVRAGTRALRTAKDCSEDIATAPEATALNDARALVLLPCLQGAYQGSSLAFFVSRRETGPATLVRLPRPYRGARDQGEDDAYLTEASFDPKTGDLATFAKGRGLADCGAAASWTWDGQAFHLASLTYQAACGGVEPGDWPTLYRTRR